MSQGGLTNIFVLKNPSVPALSLLVDVEWGWQVTKGMHFSHGANKGNKQNDYFK